ncbi:polysaccharide deacetylase [Psychrobacillus sp. Sa2BUA9]|uniref:Polysaccharide deacetylase n=1 Tax=Psychrobacillus faecigallinarum TaxID=2762235 RepID=A0ABR8RDP4_9BACI|nr:polysaccharide deacetylase family protein [Psychrobacillus faecigallinarum]MBD7945865.1 polysaccharide deacetylase [Psychrobacillus faecigallinarum]
MRKLLLLFCVSLLISALTFPTLSIAASDHKVVEKHINRLLERKKVTAPTPAPAPSSKANVYLTFDDGPNKFTTTHNSILKKYNVNGTFFFLGKHMKDNEAIVKAVASDGHYIGTHSMTHDKEKVYKNAQAFIDEINSGVSLIDQMTGHSSKLIRVPYGSKPHLTTPMKEKLKQQHYKLWDWDVDSNDWRYKDEEFQEIITNVQTEVEKAYKSGDQDIIVLLHDRSQTTKALPSIIEWLQKEGYTLKTYQEDQHVVQNFFRDETL